VPLPTYPFERKRYWIANPNERQQPKDGRTTPAGEQVAEWLYLPAWQKTTAILPIDLPENGSPRNWLVFLDESGLGEKLAVRLRSLREDVLAVKPGERFTRVGEETFTIDPYQAADYTRLLKELRTAGKLPAYVAHCWSIDAESSPDYPDIGFFSLTHLAQAAGELGIAEPLAVAIITDRLQPAGGIAPVSPQRATLLGPWKVIPQEYPNIRCKAIDIDLSTPGGGVDLEDLLIAEMLSEKADPLVAYRGGERLVQTFERAKPGRPTGKPIHLREKGVYLITGGLGGIGLTLAGYLARTVQAKLALVSRASMPEKKDWQSWLSTHGPEDRTRQKIEQIQAMEALGAEVIVFAADVADRDRMQAVLDEVREQFGALHGIIHAAGIAGGGIIQLKSRETAQQVMAPKVAGTLALDDLTGGQDLDFFILCSSLASLLGGAGQVDYCAANAFLDAFAQSRWRDGRPVISINWDRWQEVGMAVDTQAPADMQRVRSASAWQGIRPAEGVKVFERVLQLNQPQVAAATMDIRSLIATPQSPGGNGAGARAALQSAGQTMYERPTLSTEYAAPQTETERQIAGLFETLLGVKPVGINDSFFELGGHSLLAIQLVSRIREAFQTEFTVQALFDHPTAAELAGLVEKGEAPESDDVEKLMAMLDAVESLPEEEVRRLLEGKAGFSEG
jgi:NAD(P)-dependent dehydrogenase (short-subunit alcohol dehydrogenase family)/acyl carrier protein